MSESIKKWARAEVARREAAAKKNAAELEYDMRNADEESAWNSLSIEEKNATQPLSANADLLEAAR